MLAESGITSANVVGYQGLGYESAKKPLVGFTFVPVSGATTIKLGDVKATNMDPDTDAIQLLDPDTTANKGAYTYVSKEVAEDWELKPTEDYVGWWDLQKYGPGETSRNDVEVDIGRGFLLYNNKGHDIQFTCAGAVPINTTSYTTSGKKSLVATYIPTDMTLGDIVVPGLNMDPDTDAIQVLDPNTTANVAAYTYVSQERAEDWELEPAKDYVGWWDLQKYGPGETSRNGVAVKAGATFLLYNNKAHTLTFQYKSALDVTKPAEE